MERSDLIHAVQVKIDELAPYNGLAIPMDNINDKPVDMLIDGLLDEAAKDVLMRVKLSRVNVLPCLSDAEAREDGSGYVYLPDDFLRLARFKMEGWKRSVEAAIEITDPAYRMQFNEFDRGGMAKPVCALSEKNGGRVLEYFSVVGPHRVEFFDYVPLVKAERVKEGLVDALGWMCAGKVLQVTGNKLAEGAYKMAVDLLNV